MGKASKQRSCPALNDFISPSDCGGGRHTRYRCPEECTFNPFALRNYDEMLKLEEALDNKTVQWVMEHEAVTDRNLLSRLREATRSHSAHGLHPPIAEYMFFRRDANGLTSAERWERSGAFRLNNDERAMLNAKKQMRVTLLEVRRVLDAQRFEAIDLLAENPTPMVFADRSSAANFCRFATVIAWIYPMPHFWRLSGSAIIVQDQGPWSPHEVALEAINHLGAPADRDERSRWLAKNFIKVEQALTATGEENIRRMLGQMDAVFTTREYKLSSSPQDCLERLEAAPGVAPAEPTSEERDEGVLHMRVWLDEDPRDPELPALPGQRILGTVSVKKNSVILRAMTASSMGRLITLFEEALGSVVGLAAERRDNIAAQVAQKLDGAEPALIVPSLVKHSTDTVINESCLLYPAGTSEEDVNFEAREELYARFADTPVPFLHGKTPRQAASNPKLRPRLLTLIKRHVHLVDKENLQFGGTVDINPLIEELGLDEIDFPAPPPRKPPLDSSETEEDYDDEADDSDDAESHLGPVDIEPLPRGRPLTMEEAVARFAAAMTSFANAGEAVEYIQSTGATIIYELSDLGSELFDEPEFTYFMPAAISIWLTMVRADAPTPLLTKSKLRHALDREMQRLEQIEPRQLLEQLTINRRQPGMIQAVVAMALQEFEEGSEKTDPEQLMIVIVLLVVLIEELDREVSR